MYGCPIEVLETADCGLVSAAAIGATGANIYKNLKEVYNQIVHLKSLIKPNMTNHKLYTDMFEIFRDTFLALRDTKIYDRLNALSNKYWC